MQFFDTAKTVLVVDDYEPVCQLIQLVLVQVGYEVHISTTGSGALRIAKLVPVIHLIVCGLGLQDMSAEECAEECAQYHPETPVLFISDPAESIRTTRRFTAIDRAFTIKELRAAVHGAVGAPL